MNLNRNSPFQRQTLQLTSCIVFALRRGLKVRSVRYKITVHIDLANVETVWFLTNRIDEFTSLTKNVNISFHYSLQSSLQYLNCTGNFTSFRFERKSIKVGFWTSTQLNFRWMVSKSCFKPPVYSSGCCAFWCVLIDQFFSLNNWSNEFGWLFLNIYVGCDLCEFVIRRQLIINWKEAAISFNMMSMFFICGVLYVINN